MHKSKASKLALSKAALMVLLTLFASYALVAQTPTKITAHTDIEYATTTELTDTVSGDNIDVASVIRLTTDGESTLTAKPNAVVTLNATSTNTTTTDMTNTGQGRVFTVYVSGADNIVNLEGNAFNIIANREGENAKYLPAIAPISGAIFVDNGAKINFNNITTNITSNVNDMYSAAIQAYNGAEVAFYGKDINITSNLIFPEDAVNTRNPDSVGIRTVNSNTDQTGSGKVLFEGFNNLTITATGKRTLLAGNLPGLPAYGIIGTVDFNSQNGTVKIFASSDGGATAVRTIGVNTTFDAADTFISAYSTGTGAACAVNTTHDNRTNFVRGNVYLKAEATTSVARGTEASLSKVGGGLYATEGVDKLTIDVKGNIFGIGISTSANITAKELEIIAVGQNAAGDASTIYANLTTADSYVKGQLLEDGSGITNILFSNGATWMPTGHFAGINNAHATFNGAVINLANWYGKENRYRNITLTNPTLQGSNTLIINTDVQNNRADLLTITKLNDDSSNKITQLIKIGYDPYIGTLAKNGATEPITLGAISSPILLMEILDNNGKVIKGETVTSEVEGNLSFYDVLAKITTETNGNTTNIYLDTFEFGSSKKPSEQIMTIVDNANALKWLSRVSNDSIKRHLGGLRVNQELYEGGLWARTYNANLNTNSNFKKREIEQDIWGGQIGIDSKTQNSDNMQFKGIYIDYLNSNNTFNRGIGDIDNIGIVAYSSWLSGHGHYVDLTAKASRITGDFSVKNSRNEKIKGDFETWSLALNAELGMRVKLNADWSIEPQAQFTYNTINSMDYNLTSGVKVATGDIDSQIARVGASFGRDIEETGNVYVSAFYFHDFAKSANLSASYGTETYASKVNTANSWYSISAGTNLDLSSIGRFYFEVEKLLGSGINKNYLINAGIRLGF